jgi:hypothetical protein
MSKRARAQTGKGLTATIREGVEGHDVEPVTRDHDFKALAAIAGVRLSPAPARR